MGGKKSTTSAVDTYALVRVLHEEGAPQDVLQTFLGYVEDVGAREFQARQFNVPNAVVDCLAQKGDRRGLEALRDKLRESSPEWFYAQHILTTSNAKWKN